MSHPHPVDGHLPCIFVHDHLNHTGRVGEPHRRSDTGAAIFAPLKVARHGIGAFDCDRTRVSQCFFADSVEVQRRILIVGYAISLTINLNIFRCHIKFACRCVNQDIFEVLSRLDGRIADHVSHPGGIRSVVLRRNSAVVGDNSHTTHVDPQHFADDLSADGSRPLADIRRTGQNRDCTVKVQFEVDDRVRFSGPVDWLGSTTDVMCATNS